MVGSGGWKRLVRVDGSRRHSSQQCGQPFSPGAFLLSRRDRGEYLAPQLCVGEALEHGDELHRRVKHGLVLQLAGILRTTDALLELDECPLPGGNQVGVRREADYSLECDPIESRMVTHELAKDSDADGDEIPGWIIGLRNSVDTAVQPVEGALGQGGYEAVLRAEQAVHGARGGTRRFGDLTNGSRVGTAVGDESLSGSQELSAGLLVVLSGSSHYLTAYRNSVMLRCNVSSRSWLRSN